MESAAIDRAVAALIAARRDSRRIDSLPDGCAPADLDQAYAIQNALVPAILDLAGGGEIVGYKAGATNAGAMANFGLEEPFRGYLLSPFVIDSGATLAAGACIGPILESEFAFRMGDDLPPAAAPYDMDAVAAAVAGVIISIEVVDLRYTGGMAAGGLQIIADQGAAAYWVKGAERAGLDGIDFEDHPVSLSIDGQVVREGNAAVVLDNPLNSLAWLANHLCAVGLGLKAGDIVTAGTCTAPIPAQPGQTATADFGDLGQVTINFA